MAAAPPSRSLLSGRGGRTMPPSEANAFANALGNGALLRRTFDIAVVSVHAGPQASKHQTLSRLEVIASPITLWQ